MRPFFRSARSTVIALTLTVCGLTSAGFPVASQAASPPGPIKHVFTIVMENENFDDSFGEAARNNPAKSYLAKDLPAQGALLEQYYATSHFSNSNYITMLSGQPANAVNQIDCEIYSDFRMTRMDSQGIAYGQGCVFPKEVKSLPNQLEERGLTWRGYNEDMQLAYPRKPKNCQYPTPNGIDTTFFSRPWDQYAARHNPFLYFKSIRDTASCRKNDVPYTEFEKDIESISTTPNFSFIVPDQCNSAHDTPCFVDPLGLHGVARINAWLKAEVPKILNSPAFKKDGLLIITFDEASILGDSSACCNQPRGPNTLNPGLIRPGPGGGRVGSVLISPFIKPGTKTAQPYNHYSLLHTWEDLYGAPYLGYARRSDVRSFGTDVFTALP